MDGGWELDQKVRVVNIVHSDASVADARLCDFGGDMVFAHGEDVGDSMVGQPAGCSSRPQAMDLLVEVQRGGCILHSLPQVEASDDLV